jgi:hypothetical protein
MVALTPALSPEERVRGGVFRTMREQRPRLLRREREDTGRMGQGRVRVPSPGGEGQGEGELFRPTAMKRSTHGSRAGAPW